MTGLRKASSVLTITAPAIFLSGCSGAPSVGIVGSFFPAWMICMAIAVVLTFAIRYVLVKLHLESEVGPLALFYPSLLTLLTCLIWLGNFR
jgi:YtcA-like protein